jgi:predicted glycoside hydrolase/deacetylase ChbG (UPF0249 family)
MLIINADDWGGWKSATEAALACHEAGRLSSVTAMVFMADSERAADLAREHQISAGLHLNLNLRFNGQLKSAVVRAHHERLIRFFGWGKYAQLIYHPWLGESFRCVYRAQVEEFNRIYGQPPTHVDGHQHLHLCVNMRANRVIPAGQKVRRSFSFWPGEKSWLNRLYRRHVDRKLCQRYRVVDYFFSLRQCLGENRIERVARLARELNVELMTHPEVKAERDFLLGDGFQRTFAGVRMASYANL